MGTQTAPALLMCEARKIATLDDAMRHYRIELVENFNESICHGHCPLPAHHREGGKSFRVKKNIYTGKMMSWECLSRSCQANHPGGGKDVISFVAAMEQCDLKRAAEMIIDGLLVPA